METKLTLRLDEELIAEAKAWARARGISLSQAVAEFFAQLSTRSPASGLSPWTRRLAGAAARRGRAPTDRELRREHLTHLQEKHR
jgi:hypothetical protein